MKYPKIIKVCISFIPPLNWKHFENPAAILRKLLWHRKTVPGQRHLNLDTSQPTYFILFTFTIFLLSSKMRGSDTEISAYSVFSDSVEGFIWSEWFFNYVNTEIQYQCQWLKLKEPCLGLNGMFNFCLFYNLKTYLKLYNRKNQCLNSEGVLRSEISPQKSFVFHGVAVVICG